MYIIVPLSLIGIALASLAYIIWRKWPFLKKLEPDAHQVGESFIHDLAPEAVEKAKAVDWRSAWHHGMTGVEEALNVVRSAFTAIGHASERLRSSIQSVKERVDEQQQAVIAPEPESQPSPVVMPARDDEAEQQRLLKDEEQRLILDISQDPKNVNLYVALGKVYAKMNNTADAIESLKTASKLDPDDERIKERLERLEGTLHREGEQKKREESLEMPQESAGSPEESTKN